MKFRKKPVEVEAVTVFEIIANSTHNWKALPLWFRDAYEKGGIVITPEALFINTLEGRMEGKRGDWLIRGVAGELYPCKREIFDATYDAV